MTNWVYKLNCLYDKYLGRDYYYLILMSIYHIEILVFVTFLDIKYTTHTFLPMISQTEISSAQGNLATVLNYQFAFSSFQSIFLTIVILVIDFAFLFIIKNEIKHHETVTHTPFYFKLTNKRIFVIEICVLLLSMGNPVVRAMLYFMSLNTIQIYVIYRFLFKLKVFNSIIILGVYIAILELFIYPFWVLFWLWIKGV